MPRLTLSQDQIAELISENKHHIDAAKKFLSRDMDGRYKNDSNIHPLAIPGADAGELAILYATANEYGFEINEEKAFQTLIDLVGGAKHFSMIADLAHIKQIRQDPEAYSLDHDQIEKIDEQIMSAKKNGAVEINLDGTHQEGAIIQIRGEWGLYPQFHLTTAAGTVAVQAFMAHKTLIDKRHKALTQKLIEAQAVTLFDNLDEEYLYEVLSSVTEDHLLETVQRIGKGLPIYEVIFETDGGFTVEERGVV